MGITSTFARGLILGVPVGYWFVTEVGYIAKVEGESMQPSLNPDIRNEDYVFLNRWVVRDKNIQRGDIVTFTSPKSSSQRLIKRVIGLPGDVIHTLGYREEILEVPEEKCWVEGDHTGHSMDSNTFGPIPVDIITSKATRIVWPPSRWQTLDYYVPNDRTPLNCSNVIAYLENNCC